MYKFLICLVWRIKNVRMRGNDKILFLGKRGLNVTLEACFGT